MNPLKNEQHERFCQLVALGSSHTAACISAGYSKRSAIQTAARLMTIDKISARIADLQQRMADRVEITLESLIADAARCRDLGIWHGQINAAVLAVKELGILTGFRVERRETRTIDPATISDAELAAIIRAGPAIDAQAVTAEARARLEAPRDAGRNAGIGSGDTEKSATISGTASSDAVTGPVAAPRVSVTADIPLDEPVAPGTIEKAIRRIRRPNGRTRDVRPEEENRGKSKG